MTITSLIFDFDGTLLDTETPIFEEWARQYRDHGQELSIELWGSTIGTHGKVDLAVRLAELASGNLDPEELRGEVRPRVRQRVATQSLRRGVVEVLGQARRAGLGIAIASSSTSDWVGHWVVQHDLGEMIDHICGRDHVEHVKPAPDLFVLAAERLGHPATSCLVFEDSPNGVLAAHAAGMRCVAVPNFVTRRLPMPVTEVVLDSFAGIDLAEILRRATSPLEVGAV